MKTPICDEIVIAILFIDLKGKYKIMKENFRRQGVKLLTL